MRDPNLDQLNQHFQKEIEAYHHKPQSELDYLSPNDLQVLLYETFQAHSPIQYQLPLSEETLVQSGFFQLARELMRSIQAAGEIKLSAKGNLPRQLTKDLYEKKWVLQPDIELGISKLAKEQDFHALHTARLIIDIGGLSKKRNGKLSLTKKGQKFLEPAQAEALFALLFETFAGKFNWGYHDGFMMDERLQMTFGFQLYLLLRYGSKSRVPDFYSEKLGIAFPFLLESLMGFDLYAGPKTYMNNCLTTRLFDRFLVWFGLVKQTRERNYPQGIVPEYQRTELLMKIFRLDPGKFQMKKPNVQA
jgi:hypothetical protein